MSKNELIQIVDEEDRPVSASIKQKAWQDGLIHRVSRVIVEDGKGNILLQKRAASMEIFPNCWGNSAAGHVDLNESYEHAAKRELFEELGIKADRLDKLGYFFVDSSYGAYRLRRFATVYKIIIKDTPKNIRTQELSEVKWFSVKEIRDLMKNHPDKIEDGLKQVIERFY